MIKIIETQIGENGKQRIKGYVDDKLVITLSDAILDDNGNGIWSVSSSCTLVSDVDTSKKYAECIQKSFESLEKIK